MMKLLKSEWLLIPFRCVLSVAGGYLLSAGTVAGAVSPLAAAIAGICSPLYDFCILLGSLLAYCIKGAPAEQQFLLTCLISLLCIRLFFSERYSPWISGVMTAVVCISAGILTDLLFQNAAGKLPAYILESFLTGAASYFLSDAVRSFRETGKITLNTGKSFTYAVCYLLLITAVCGIDFTFCNPGRILGITVTLLAARQFHQSAGTLCGALTACGVVLCSVPLGTPLLFLPVTAMLAGFLYQIPNAFYIPVFFLMQICSSAVFDSSIGIIKVLAELIISCTVYAVFCQTEFRNFISVPAETPAGQRQVIQQEIFLSTALQELREETAAVMRHLPVSNPPDPVQKLRETYCQQCRYTGQCWKQHAEQTSELFRQMLHTPSGVPELPAFCPERKHLAEMSAVLIQRRTVRQMQNTALLQNREMLLESLRLLERITADSARRRALQFCDAGTSALKNILLRCAVHDEGCFVSRLRSGRYTAEVYSGQKEFPLAAVRELLSRYLDTDMRAVSFSHRNLTRHCFYEMPVCHLEYAILSRNAPAYERCGDHADAFTDSAGNQYLVISDGMGSGSTASLASQIAVRTFRKLTSCDMPVESAVSLLNSILMTETNTENFATLDILFLNADTGELTFYKSGSAASLFCRNSDMQEITADSFPLGMMTGTGFSRTTRRTQNNDYILLLSDGISEAEYPYIRQLLSQHPKPEQIPEMILEKAAVFHGGTVRDDMTVIAAQTCTRDSFPVRHGKKRQNKLSGVAVR